MLDIDYIKDDELYEDDSNYLSINARPLKEEFTYKINYILYIIESSKNQDKDAPIHLDNIDLVSELILEIGSDYYSNQQLSLKKALIDLYKKIENQEGVQDACIKIIEYLCNTHIDGYLEKVTHYVDQYAQQLIKTTLINLKDQITDQNKLTELYNTIYQNTDNNIKLNFKFTNSIINQDKLVKVIMSKYIQVLDAKNMISDSLGTVNYTNNFIEDLNLLVKSAEVDDIVYPGQVFSDKLDNQKIGVTNLFDTPSLFIHDKESFIIDSYQYDQELDLLTSKIKEIFQNNQKIQACFMGGTDDLEKRDTFISNIKTIFSDLHLEHDITILTLGDNINELVLDVNKLIGDHNSF